MKQSDYFLGSALKRRKKNNQKSLPISLFYSIDILSCYLWSLSHKACGIQSIIITHPHHKPIRAQSAISAIYCHYCHYLPSLFGQGSTCGGHTCSTAGLAAQQEHAQGIASAGTILHFFEKEANQQKNSENLQKIKAELYLDCI